MRSTWVLGTLSGSRTRLLESVARSRVVRPPVNELNFRETLPLIPLRNVCGPRCTTPLFTPTIFANYLWTWPKVWSIIATYAAFESHLLFLYPYVRARRKRIAFDDLCVERHLLPLARRLIPQREIIRSATSPLDNFLKTDQIEPLVLNKLFLRRRCCQPKNNHRLEGNWSFEAMIYQWRVSIWFCYIARASYTSHGIRIYISIDKKKATWKPGKLLVWLSGH